MSKSMAPRYIFLSHKSEDKLEVRQLVDKLESHPLAIKHKLLFWLDERDMNRLNPYPAQFPEVIFSDDTCAFLLFMPKDSLQGIRGYVDREVQTALDRHNESHKMGKSFPLIPVYPRSHEERMPLPAMLKIYQHREHVLTDGAKVEEIITDVLGLAKKVQEPVSSNSTELELADSKKWLCYILEINGEEIIAENFFTEIITRIPKNHLLPLNPSEDYSATLEQLFPALFTENSGLERLRIMTDDPELAVLPWRELGGDVIVEVSPEARRYIEGFDEKSTLNTPLAVIPGNAKHGIAGNKHYSALVGYFNSHLGMRGPLPRVTNVRSLGRELTRHQPDFIYLYARYGQSGIVLDRASSPVPGKSENLTLDELGDWLRDAVDQSAMLKPIVVLSLIGGVLTAYPEQLVRHCKLLWVQSVKMKGDCTLIENQLAHSLESLSANGGDLIRVINQQSDKRISSQVWLNGQPVCFDNNSGLPLSGQLRAALLRVMLGRDNLKGMLRDKIDRPEHRSGGSFLVYAVTGDAPSCPFDVPSQLQSRLDWEDQEKGLPVIPLYFSLKIDPDADAYDELDTMLDQGLRHGTDDMGQAFQSMLNRRGVSNSDNCIALNWSISLPSGMVGELGRWLEAWGEVMSDYIADYIPLRTIMLSALCIQVEDQSVAQMVQDNANRSLQALHNVDIRLIRVREALGRLYDDEIEDFFNYNERWRFHLKLDVHDIDVSRYAAWIYDRTSGEFDATVNEIWKQYQNDYQDYPKP